MPSDHNDTAVSINPLPEKIISDVGLSSRVKEAFTAFVGKGIYEIQPITKQLQIFCQRPQAERFRIAPARMVDDVEAILKGLWRNDNDNNKAVDAGLPVIVMAYAPSMRPAQPAHGWSRVQGEAMKLELADKDYFDVRLAFKEWDVQIAVFAHEQESVIAIMDYLRMYFFRFQNHRWPIHWKHAGKEFKTYGMLCDGFEPEEIAVPLQGRTNIFCHAFNFPITFMMPYIGEKVPAIKAVEMQIKLGGDMTVNGTVTSENNQDWPL
jgi:hypothetical protein